MKSTQKPSQLIQCFSLLSCFVCAKAVQKLIKLVTEQGETKLLVKLISESRVGYEMSYRLTVPALSGTWTIVKMIREIGIHFGLRFLIRLLFFTSYFSHFSVRIYPIRI